MNENLIETTSDLRPDLTITWHDKTIEDIYSEMDISPSVGLTTEQVGCSLYPEAKAEQPFSGVET